MVEEKTDACTLFIQKMCMTRVVRVASMSCTASRVMRVKPGPIRWTLLPSLMGLPAPKY